MKTKIIIGVALLVIALVLIVLSGGGHHPTSDDSPTQVSIPDDEGGVKGLKINP